MTKCTCIDCMYGGNVGNEHGGITLPSSEKGDDGMSEVNPRDFMVRDPEIGDGKVIPDHFLTNRSNVESLPKFPGSVSSTFGCAYEVSCSGKARVTLHKEKALQIASEMLDCDGKVEIKRIELS